MTLGESGPRENWGGACSVKLLLLLLLLLLMVLLTAT